MVQVLVGGVSGGIRNACGRRDLRTTTKPGVRYGLADPTKGRQSDCKAYRLQGQPVQFASNRSCAITNSPSMIRLSTSSNGDTIDGAIFQPAPPVM